MTLPAVAPELQEPVTQNPATPAPVQPPATEPIPPVKTEHMIPKARLDEEIAKRDKAEKDLQKLQSAETKRQEALLTKEQLLEKQQKAATAKAEKADQDIAAVRAEADTKLLKAAFLLKAKDMGFENPADAFALANKTVKKKDDGEFDETSIEAALKPLLTRLPIKTQTVSHGTPKLQLTKNNGSKLETKPDYKIPRI